jgi:hypothetical protein
MNLRLRRRALGATIATTAAAAAVAGLAPAAQAASGPVITSGSCTATSFFFECPVTWAGGTDPATVQWTAVAHSSISGSITNAPAHTSTGEGNCVPNSSFEVKVTVTDARGLSASTFLGGPCDA